MGVGQLRLGDRHKGPVAGYGGELAGTYGLLGWGHSGIESIHFKLRGEDTNLQFLNV